MQVHVLDERLEPVSPGVDGELYIGGVGLARGYLSQRELTAERFVPNPFGREPGSRLYCAGDRARVRVDGNLEFLGRSDRQVKIRGCRIEPGDVEEALRAHAGLGDTRVCAQPINGEETLVAYVATGGRVEAASVQAALADALPSYMIPAHIVRVPAWPLLPNGKLDWSALPAPAVRASAGRSAYAAPRNALEEAVAVVFAEVLDLEAVGADDTFFELGGHSLKATKVVARAASRGIELSLTDLFRHGSPARIANAIIGRRFAATPEAIPRGPARSLPIPQPPATHHAVSHGQRRLWILEHFGEARPYHMCAAFEITGAFDVAALEEAFRGVIARHESLRTRIIDVNGEPRQQIVAHADFAIGRLDVQSDPDPAGRVTELAKAFFREPFELAAGPLLRVTDVQLDAARHLMLFCQHHIVSDGASVGVMVRELLARYGAIRGGRVPAFPPLPFQYKDYAAWQLEQLESPAAAASRRYWLEIFADPVEPLKLPFDLPLPHVRRQDGGHLRFHIDVEAAVGLSALAGSCGTSLFMALMAAVQLLLYRYTRQREMVLGTPVANRDLPELDDQIGFYVNLLPLRLALKPSMTFTDLLGEVTHRVSSALEHQAYPFDRLVEDLKPPIDTRRSPLFDVVVVMQNHDTPGFELPGAAVREWPIETGVAKFGLTFEFTNTGEGLDGVLEFNTTWFKPETAARLVDHLSSLIRSALGAPGRPISELSILSDTDVAHGANGPARPDVAPVTETLVERFERHVARQPGAIAVKHDGLHLTYHDLDARASRLASRLVHEHGVGPETVVALLSPRTEAMVVGVLAILKAGGAYLPLDPTDPPERTGRLIERSGARLLLHGRGVPLPPLDRGLASTSLDDAAIPADASRALPRVEPGNLAYVIYTSGSTGEPKGVAVTHASMARLFRATEPLFQFGSGDIWAAFHSLAFDFSVWEIWGALAHGGTLVVVDYETSRSPDRFAGLLAREGVTVLNQTPTAFGAFTKALVRHGDPGLALRWVVFGGEALRPSMLAAWWKLGLAAKPRLVNMYGITETTVHTTFREVRPEDAAPGDASVIGVALDDVRMHVLDEAMTPVPPGSAGELYVAGAGVARGYLGDPSRTAERFLADPLSGRAGDRFYRTGDLGRWRHDGTLEYLGRNDRQRKIRGFRIELGEIEAELRTHPDVSDAMVVLREAADGPALIAYLVSGDAALSLDSLRSHLGRRLAAHMMPSRFVRVERWPLTANGKIDVNALADAEGERLESAAFVLPETSIERRLARLWSEALSVEQVSAVDDFFELGGHSISAIKVVQGIRDAFGQAVSLSVVFEYPVLRDLAGYLQSTSEPAGDSGS
jgi:amino acid adenylation domain-containing protein